MEREDIIDEAVKEIERKSKIAEGIVRGYKVKLTFEYLGGIDEYIVKARVGDEENQTSKIEYFEDYSKAIGYFDSLVKKYNLKVGD